MTQKTTHSILGASALLVSTLLILTGCGSAFQASQNAACTTNCQTNSPSGGGSTGGGAGSQENEDWKNANMDGQLGSGRFASKQVISLDKKSKELVLSLPMPANPFIDGVILDIPLKDLPGAHVRVEPLADGGSALVLRVPLKYLMKGVDFLPPGRLPNGDPLPSIPDGEMPSLAVQLSNIKNIKASIYLSVATLGIFVNTPFDPLIYLSIPIRNTDGSRTLGYLTSVPAKQGKDGGFFIAVQIPDDLARVIDDNL